MTNLEKLKNVIKSVNYMISGLGVYYSDLSYEKITTRISFVYNSYNENLFCYIKYFKNKFPLYTKTLIIKTKLK